MNKQPDFQHILKAKRDYYGHTEAAIEFAAEEYASILLNNNEATIKKINEKLETIFNIVRPHINGHKTVIDLFHEIMNDMKDFSNYKNNIDTDELDELLMWVVNILDGWHGDGTAWSEWDESIRQKVMEYRIKYTYEKNKTNSSKP